MGTGFWSILISRVCFGTKEMQHFVVCFLLGMGLQGNPRDVGGMATSAGCLCSLELTQKGSAHLSHQLQHKLRKENWGLEGVFSCTYVLLGTAYLYHDSEKEN